MGISCLGSFGKYCFDMRKSIGVRNLVILFSSSRWSDRVSLGWFVRDLVGRLFKMQVSRLSVKTHLSSSYIGSSLSSGFQVYLCKCWDPYVSQGLVDLCEIWLGGCLRWKLRDDQYRLTRALVLLVPLLALGFKSTSLSAGIHMWVQAVWHNLLSFGCFFLVFEC